MDLVAPAVFGIGVAELVVLLGMFVVPGLIVWAVVRTRGDDRQEP